MEPAVDPPTDGRRARGAASRQAIVEAAGRVAVAGGLAAVTHRAVAEEAGVPLARTTYHFPTVDALLRAVQQHLTKGSTPACSRSSRPPRAGTRRSSTHAATSSRTCSAPIAASSWPASSWASPPRRPELLSVGSLSAAGVIPIIKAFGADDDQARATFAAVYGFAVIVATQPNPISAAEIRRFVTATIPSRRQRRVALS